MARDTTNDLRSGEIGTVGIAFFVLAFAAPLTGIIGLAPIALGSGGSPGTPGVFLLTTVILLVFSVGFAAMSRHRSGPGGFAVYIGEAFGSRAGSAASCVALLGYNCFLVGNTALFSATTRSIVNDRLGVDLSWWIYAFGAVAALSILGYREVKLSVRVLGVVLLLEVVIVLLLDARVLLTGAGDVNVDGFDPSAITDGRVGIVFLLAVAAFVGFEATTLFGDEARDRHRTIPRATYLAVSLVGVFYILSMWMLQVGWGDDATRAADGDPSNFLFDLNSRFVGGWSTDLMVWLVVTSIFAALLSVHGALSRYMFAMGREGLLPRRLGDAHPSMRSPHRASLMQSAITVVAMLVAVLLDADPLTVLVPWFVGVGSVGILLLYVFASVAVCRSLRKVQSEERIWVTTVAPLISAAAMSAVLVLAVANFEFLTGSERAVVNALWVLPAIAGVVGYLLPKAGRPPNLRPVIRHSRISPSPSKGDP